MQKNPQLFDFPLRIFLKAQWRIISTISTLWMNLKVLSTSCASHCPTGFKRFSSARIIASASSTGRLTTASCTVRHHLGLQAILRLLRRKTSFTTYATPRRSPSAFQRQLCDHFFAPRLPASPSSTPGWSRSVTQWVRPFSRRLWPSPRQLSLLTHVIWPQRQTITQRCFKEDFLYLVLLCNGQKMTLVCRV